MKVIMLTGHLDSGKTEYMVPESCLLDSSLLEVLCSSPEEGGLEDISEGDDWLV